MSELVDTSEQHRLLAEAKQHTANSTGQHRLLQRIEAAEHRLAGSQPRTTRAGMVLDPLTPRELDVLRLMRGDLSVREIGVELYISHNTAKGYAKTIYRKLGVRSRRDAVATATAADLI
jgi:LuxR family maltose regulon positive regulatory protein